ncbi:MAG: hypothetical protein ACTIA3_10810 [Corynebacterium casei]|uniref:hypothetical protein n=1 Tax=Corynebacterium casei TaxID=160386 RepID=UPI003F8DD6FB
MELDVKLSPLVYESLYSLLVAQEKYQETLSQRLGEIGRETSWLAELAEAYADPVEGVLVSLDSDHAVLASWILSSLRNEGPSTSFNNLLKADLSEKVVLHGIDLNQRTPEFNPFVDAWILGKDFGVGASYLPRELPVNLNDEDILSAYRGLMAHTALLLESESNWSELSANSLLWRVSGLVEGLASLGTSEGLTLKQSYDRLVQTHRDVLPKVRLTGWSDFDEVKRYRNVLTHLGSDGELTFKAAASRVNDMSNRDGHINLVRIITQLVCAEIGGLLQQASLPGSAEWDTLKWSLRHDW